MVKALASPSINRRVPKGVTAIIGDKNGIHSRDASPKRLIQHHEPLNPPLFTQVRSYHYGDEEVSQIVDNFITYMLWLRFSLTLNSEISYIHE